jgi:hypothetical protein
VYHDQGQAGSLAMIRNSAAQAQRLLSPPADKLQLPKINSVPPRTQKAQRVDKGTFNPETKPEPKALRTSFLIETDRTSNFISIDIPKNINRFFDQPLSDHQDDG